MSALREIGLRLRQPLHGALGLANRFQALLWNARPEPPLPTRRRGVALSQHLAESRAVLGPDLVINRCDIGTRWLTILNAYGNPIPHFGDIDTGLINIDQKGPIKRFLG